MRIPILMFGVVAGFLWAFVPGTISELFRSNGETVAVLVAGVVTGVLTSITLSALVRKSPTFITFYSGLLSLPLGAFLFGVSISVSQLVASVMTGTNYRFVEEGFHPIQLGLEYAFYSVFSVFVFILLPLAVLTTFLLRVAVRWQGHIQSEI